MKAVVDIGKFGTFGAAALTLLLVAGTAQAKDPVAEGRYHLRKANELAGDDRCRAAIREYTLAYQKLHDLVVLFNRAECYRRIGEGPQAIADYRAFLEAVPAAPNRGQIEAKIAALGAPASAAASTAGSTVRSTEPSPIRPIATVPPPSAPSIADQSERAAALPLAPAPPVTLVETEASPRADTESHQGKTWIWIALGAAVAGGAVGAYLALRTPATVPPTTALGNYKF